METFEVHYHVDGRKSWIQVRAENKDFARRKVMEMILRKQGRLAVISYISKAEQPVLCSVS